MSKGKKKLERGFGVLRGKLCSWELNLFLRRSYFNLSKGLWVIITNINCDRLQDSDILAPKPVGMLYSVSLYQTASSSCIFSLIGG